MRRLRRGRDLTRAALTAKLSDSAQLDLVFVIDATGSMGSYIAAAQRTMGEIVEAIVSKERADVQFALVSYRDHPPQYARAPAMFRLTAAGTRRMS